VLFTPLKSLKDATRMGVNEIRDAVTAVYLEGDVRVNLTPPSGPAGEQRLEARRVYYELATDRAVLANAVLHTQEPRQQIPVVVRAKVVRQLSQGEYRADGVKLSTSTMALPSYAIAADRVYVRNVGADEAPGGVARTDFRARGATFQLFDLPLFYLPYAAGSMSQGAQAFRGINFGSQNAFGPNVRTEWGLFETLGVVPPPELDVRYDVDYYAKRGFAGGVAGEYSGGFLTDVDKERWTFRGDFDAYLVYDRGEDDFGRGRLPADRDGELRGQALWRHQHFFGEDYQVQLRAGWASDPNFLEQWYRRDWRTRDPRDFMAYVKKQHDNEAYTFYANVNPNGFVTTADEYQEQFEVEHLPELGYRRLGDSPWDQRLTTFSENTVGVMRFNLSHTPPAELGFGPGRDPGLPAVGFTGTTEDYVLRGDFRQEIDWPLNAGRFKVVPYVVGRLTSYNDSPTDGSKNRLLAGAGMRMSTAFWKVDDTVESRLLDLHRLRHVVEPEVNLFTSAATVDRGELFIYEEDVDKVTDLSAAQIALRQRWQTKRGGAGRWRNVDFFTLNVEGNFFANQPRKSELAPTDFRGLFFASIPEASVPRNSINANATWRVSDNTVALADAQYNLDDSRLATAAVGLVVRRDERMSYYVGTRYIDVLNSNITTIAGTYEISPKYTIALGQSYDFGIGQNVASSAAILRKFDRFLMSLRVVYNSSTDESGFSVNFVPTGTNYGFDTDVLGNTFRPR
jgi:lipopolysaccharide assembly outer membrane protein LptD (OstA)